MGITTGIITGWVQEESTRNKNLPEKFSVQTETVHLEWNNNQRLFNKCTHLAMLLSQNPFIILDAYNKNQL